MNKRKTVFTAVAIGAGVMAVIDRIRLNKKVEELEERTEEREEDLQHSTTSMGPVMTRERVGNPDLCHPQALLHGQRGLLHFFLAARVVR